MLLSLAEFCFWLAAVGVLLVVAGNPAAIAIGAAWHSLRGRLVRGVASNAAGDPQEWPAISLVTVAHRPGDMLQEKLDNVLTLDYPPGLLEIIFASDGDDPHASEICERLAAALQDRGIRLRVIGHAVQRGKNACLNDALAMACGEIVVFSDVDARLSPDALQHLVRPFRRLASSESGGSGFNAQSAWAEVGGVGGRRVLKKERKAIAGIQGWYWKLDAWMKTTESSLGAVTANDGKLYAVRRHLLQPVPDGVTDDLYNCLTVLRQRRRFLYVPEATASVPTPSRSGGHEVSRRRRIVSRSLRGVWLSRELLNPLAFGWLAVRLGINKVLRRLLPCLLGVMVGTSFLLSFTTTPFLLMFLAACLFFALAMLHPLLQLTKAVPPPVNALTSAAYYVVMGMYGTWLGFLDFLNGRAAIRWTSRKEG